MAVRWYVTRDACRNKKPPAGNMTGQTFVSHWWETGLTIRSATSWQWTLGKLAKYLSSRMKNTDQRVRCNHSLHRVRHAAFINIVFPKIYPLATFPSSQTETILFYFQIFCYSCTMRTYIINHFKPFCRSAYRPRLWILSWLPSADSNHGHGG